MYGFVAIVFKVINDVIEIEIAEMSTNNATIHLSAAMSQRPPQFIYNVSWNIGQSRNRQMCNPFTESELNERREHSKL